MTAQNLQWFPSHLEWKPRSHTINLPTCHCLCYSSPSHFSLTTLPSCCSPNVSATFLPQDLCMCSVFYWYALPSDIFMAPSVIPFRSLLKCHLLCEEHPALSDIFLSMALITLWYTISHFYFFIFRVACLSPRECKLCESRNFCLCFHHWNSA